MEEPLLFTLYTLLKAFNSYDLRYKRTRDQSDKDWGWWMWGGDVTKR